MSELDENELFHVSPAAPQIHPQLQTINTPQQLTSRFSRQPPCCSSHSLAGQRCCLHLFPAGVRCRPYSILDISLLSPAIVQCRFPRYLLRLQLLEWHKIRPKVHKMPAESVESNFLTSHQQLQIGLTCPSVTFNASGNSQSRASVVWQAVKLANSKLLNLKLFVHSNMSRY